MDLSNQTLDRFSIQIAEGVSFNPDIFEANLVNLIILVGGLFYLLSGALSESLSERQQKILGAIQESEEKLEEATKRLADSETQLAQAQIVIDSIGTDAALTAKQVQNTILAEGKAEVERLTVAAKRQIGVIEARVRRQIYEYISALAVKRISLQLEGKLNSSLQQQIIDRNISKLA